MTPARLSADAKLDAALARATDAFRHGDIARALKEARVVLRKRPDSEPALHIAGVTAAAAGDHAQACRSLERLRALHPQMPADLLRTLATSYRALNRFDDAVAAYRAAVDADPGGWEALNDLGTALAGGDDPAAAVPILEQACALAPDRPEPALNLGNALRAAGDLDKARDAFRAAIRCQADFVSAHANLAYVKTFTDFGDGDLAELERLAGDPRQSDTARTRLGFARAKAYDEIGDVERAFDALEQANTLARKGVRGDPNDDVARLEAWRTAFAGSPTFAAADASPGPIFVLGMPRSGSTLVERMLAVDDAVFAAGERHDLRRLIYDGQAEHDRVARRWTRAKPNALRRLAEAYRAAVAPSAGPCPRWVDKMPYNVAYVPLIVSALDGARIIYCRRNPVATCFSVYQQHFRTDVPWAYNLTEIAAYHRACTRTMDQWCSQYGAAILTVDYEDLVADPQNESRRVFDFCGLPWTEAVLAFHTRPGAVHTASASQVRQPLNTAGVERWRRYEPYLGTLTAALGEAHADTEE